MTDSNSIDRNGPSHVTIGSAYFMDTNKQNDGWDSFFGQISIEVFGMNGPMPSFNCRLSVDGV